MTDQQMIQLFQEMKTVVMVGLSNNPMRASFGVSRFLQRQGYRIIPVNPSETEVLGERAYATLGEVPDPIDVVNIFRRYEYVLPVVEEALGRRIRCIWLPEGIVHREAEAKAQAAGIPMVMDRCILKDLARLLP